MSIDILLVKKKTVLIKSMITRARGGGKVIFGDCVIIERQRWRERSTLIEIYYVSIIIMRECTSQFHAIVAENAFERHPFIHHQLIFEYDSHASLFTEMKEFLTP